MPRSVRIGQIKVWTGRREGDIQWPFCARWNGQSGAESACAAKKYPALELVRAKREWMWKASVEELRRGFRGWHQRGYLPHFDAPNVTQMLTFMLYDSFTATRRAEWEPLLKASDAS